jgi:hypothetical protein
MPEDDFHNLTRSDWAGTARPHSRSRSTRCCLRRIGQADLRCVVAGHFNQLEVPDQVNAMIEGFLRHYV